MNSRKFKLVPEAVAQRCSVKKMFLEISENLQETIKKETLTQALSCEFCEISMNSFSYRTPPAAASIVFNIFDLFNCAYCSLAWMFHKIQNCTTGKIAHMKDVCLQLTLTRPLQKKHCWKKTICINISYVHTRFNYKKF